VLSADPDETTLPGGALPGQVAADHFEALVQIRETRFQRVFAHNLLNRRHGHCKLILGQIVLRQLTRPEMFECDFDFFLEQIPGQLHEFEMLAEHLEIPFVTAVLGVAVTVTAVELTASDEIVAVCRRGRDLLRVTLLELPMPDPRPGGAEWVDAYRLWTRPG